MVVHMRIEFDDNPHSVYYAGQTINGKITLSVDKPKQVKGIALRISGFSHTQWQEKGRCIHTLKCQMGKLAEFSGHVDYIDSTTSLLVPDDDHTLVIEPGVHSFAFNCQLPATCPSSFEGRDGHIRYVIKVILVRPWKFDQSCSKGFTVLKQMDLNTCGPMCKLPIQVDRQALFWCWPCSSAPLQLRVSIPQSGYVCGQAIPVSVLVVNESGCSLKTINVRLLMMICYISEHCWAHSSFETLTIAELSGEGVPRHSRQMFKHLLLVPPTPPTCTDPSHLIRITYQIEVEACMGTFNANQLLTIPITIGNVPMLPATVLTKQPTYGDGNLTEYNQAQGDEMAKAGPSRSIMSVEMRAITVANAQGSFKMTEMRRSSLIWTDSPKPRVKLRRDFPTPTYEAAPHVRHVKINENDPHDYGQADFTPLYPVFHIPSLPYDLPSLETALDGGYVNPAMDHSTPDKLSA